MVAVRITLCLALLFFATTASADPYFNSAESGCNGSNSNVLTCEDFERKANGSTPGEWYAVDCDTARRDGGLGVASKGWCGTIYSNPITPAGAVLCGSGVTPFGNCAGNGGTHKGAGARNMALRHFKTATCGTDGSQRCGVSEVYVRWYAKWLPGYGFGGEKHMNVTNADGDIAFANVQLNCGAGGASSSATPSIQVLHGMNTCQRPNVSDITIQSGRWYFFEMHVKAGSSGLIELWINDCGTAGTSCGAAPILRTRLTGPLPGNSNGSQIETVWLENWANPASVGTGPLWDQLKVSRVGPIGFSGSSGSSGGIVTADSIPPAAPSTPSIR
jgi:hypothetical protein